MKKLFAVAADYIRETDKIMLLLCVVATSYGCVAVLSATNFTGSIRHFLVQSASMLLGVFAAIVLSTYDFKKMLEKWYIIAAIGMLPVLLTFVIGTGPAGTDDKAWLNLGFTTFQPSELLKVCFICTLAYHISLVHTKINQIRYLIPVCAHGFLPVLLIHLQGDDGTALIFAIIFLTMMSASGLKAKYFLIAFLVLVVAAPLIYFFIMSGDQQSRIRTIFDIDADLQGAGWQQWRGRIALAGGGFFGQGLFKGNLTQMGTAGVPEGYNDFIFVCIGEELGFLGIMAVIGLLLAICFRCIYVARITGNIAGKIICVGYFGMIAAQMIINIGMCTSILPVIGVTLPFFSAGGTSLICTYLGAGLVMNVYMHRNYMIEYLHSI